MKKATQIVHWPGQDTLACDDHAKKLKVLGSVMGVRISATPVETEAICKNCENEHAKLSQG